MLGASAADEEAKVDVFVPSAPVPPGGRDLSRWSKRGALRRIGARVSAADGSHWEAPASELAQQARSNLTARAHASHHAPALLLLCNGR
jgi:hypothetical protein